MLPTSATTKTDTEINHVNPSCVLSPSICSPVFPGVRAAYIKTSFVPQLGAIGPVSLLLAGHSCDEAGQCNSVGFHEAERRGWLQTQREGGGWLGARNLEHKAFI